MLFIYSTILVKAYYIMAVIIYKPFSIRSCNENIFVALQRALLQCCYFINLRQCNHSNKSYMNIIFNCDVFSCHVHVDIHSILSLMYTNGKYIYYQNNRKTSKTVPVSFIPSELLSYLKYMYIHLTILLKFHTMLEGSGCRW